MCFFFLYKIVFISLKQTWHISEIHIITWINLFCMNDLILNMTDLTSTANIDGIFSLLTASTSPASIIFCLNTLHRRYDTCICFTIVYIILKSGYFLSNKCIEFELRYSSLKGPISLCSKQHTVQHWLFVYVFLQHSPEQQNGGRESLFLYSFTV